MKVINKIFCVLLFLTALNIDAATKINVATKTKIEDLVIRMGNSENVRLFVKHRVFALYNHYIEDLAEKSEVKKFHKDEGDKNYVKSNDYKKAMEAEFIEFAQMNDIEKGEVLKKVLNTPQMALIVNSSIKCFGQCVLGFVACAFGTLSGWRAWAFGACFYAAVAADILAIAAQPETLSIAWPAIRIEATACWELSAEVVATQTASIMTNCGSAATFAMAFCF